MTSGQSILFRKHNAISKENADQQLVLLESNQGFYNAVADHTFIRLIRTLDRDQNNLHTYHVERDFKVKDLKLPYKLWNRLAVWYVNTTNKQETHSIFNPNHLGWEAGVMVFKFRGQHAYNVPCFATLNKEAINGWYTLFIYNTNGVHHKIRATSMQILRLLSELNFQVSTETELETFKWNLSEVCNLDFREEPQTVNCQTMLSSLNHSVLSVSGFWQQMMTELINSYSAYPSHDAQLAFFDAVGATKSNLPGRQLSDHLLEYAFWEALFNHH
ncbi:hypothetical protein OH460_07665 [Vibrio sp. Makdt]|uniref:hypothetical protein n=1 Tax=Vibrio sp. Makdt TaxID=2998828 RepID=UPI0022CD4737|nr:hypothetical protein [Vibrio sp. Makdt]MDA0152173.1 hypothetical protein [Vibrio sp. Makdt]